MDSPLSKKNTIYLVLGGILGLLVLTFVILGFKVQWTIHQITAFATKQDEYQLFDAFGEKKTTFEHLPLPEPQANRQNFLIVGMRGFGMDDGPLLTDTMLLVSIEKDPVSGLHRSALISVPRDLFVQVPYGQKTKINELYTIGYEKGGEKLAFNLVKTVVSEVTGVYIDGMIRIDFNGFQKIIDTIGGVDVYLQTPFQEVKQWEGAGGFFLPKGLNHLNGEQALYFSRSRFSTSDFDRARRQQIVLLAVKKKLATLGILSNPLKVYSILDILGSHIRTDVSMGVGEGLSLLSDFNDNDMRKLVLSTENFLNQGIGPHKAYILTPKDETYGDIHQAVGSIFGSNPSGSSGYIAPQAYTALLVHATSTTP